MQSENFIKKIYFLLINLLPNKSLRHKLRDTYNHQNDYILSFKDAIIKKQVFLKNKDKYNTVLLGSSHCEYAFNPTFFKTQAFNFGLKVLKYLQKNYMKI